MTVADFWETGALVVDYEGTMSSTQLGSYEWLLRAIRPGERGQLARDFRRATAQVRAEERARRIRARRVFERPLHRQIREKLVAIREAPYRLDEEDW